MKYTAAFIIIILSLTTLLQAAPLTLSVIIDNYNYGEYVTEAVDSVLAQTHLPDEIIVVDDGSTDGSQALLKERYIGNPRIQLIFQENKGQATAFNTGYAASHGDIICFLDADDTLKPGYFEKVITVFQSHPLITMTLSNVEKFGAVSKIEDPYPAEGDRGHYATFATQHWLNGALGSSMAFRRKILDLIFPIPFVFTNLYKTHGDSFFVIGSLIVGGTVYYIKEPYFNYRRHTRNDSEKYIHSQKYRFYNHLLDQKCATYYQKKGFFPKSLSSLALSEFNTKSHPTDEEYATYHKIIMDDCACPKINKRQSIETLQKAYQEKTEKPSPSLTWEIKKAQYTTWLSGKA